MAFIVSCLWWSTLCLLLCLFHVPQVFCDNLALLSGTLKTYQRYGCDDQVVTLKCPHGTSISVDVAQYGKTASSRALCPQSGYAATKFHQQRTPQQNGEYASHNITCLWPTALQYSLLQTVVETCQKKRRCKFRASPGTLVGDPCPGAGAGAASFVEVAYKCRPYEFRTKVACEDHPLTLYCNPNFRIAVYSASFGRTEYESIQCPQPQGVREETCLVSYATETVMSMCHGRRLCSLTAGDGTFGNPCRPETRMYLKVVFTCVPRKVLKQDLEEPQREDEPDLPEDVDEDEDEDDDPSVFSPSPNVEGGISRTEPGNRTKDSAGKSTPKPPPHAKVAAGQAPPPPSPPHTHTHTHTDMQADDVDNNNDDDNCTSTTMYFPGNPGVVGFLSEWINAITFMAQNEERVYLYTIVSACCGLLLVLLVAVARLLLLQRRRRRRRRDGPRPADDDNHKFAKERTLANGFTDDASEEAEPEPDMDLRTPTAGVRASTPATFDMRNVAAAVRASTPATFDVAVHTSNNNNTPSTSVSDVIRFSTVRRPNNATTMAVAPPPSTLGHSEAPRSLNRGGNNHYYYG